MLRKNTVKTRWSRSFAYAVGLIAADGNLSSDGRHINLTSKDREVVEVFKTCLKLSNKIGKKSRGGEQEKKYYVIQFGDKNFYEFLLSIGLTPAKSKTISRVNVPRRFFPDFLRGCFDGDGNIDVHAHPESRHPQIRARLSSASNAFLYWIKDELAAILKLKGGWVETYKASVLNYGKEDAIVLFRYIYRDSKATRLERKFLQVKPFLRMCPRGGTGRRAALRTLSR